MGSSFDTVTCILTPTHSLDEGFKSSAYLPETLLDPDFAHSSEANKAALNKAFNFEGDMWSWFEIPDNRLRLARFGAAMSGLKNMLSADAILEGWSRFIVLQTIL
jgi:hypothetical protein